MPNLLKVKTILEKCVISIFDLSPLGSNNTLQDVENNIFQWDPAFQIPAYVRRAHIKSTSMTVDHQSDGV